MDFSGYMGAWPLAVTKLLLIALGGFLFAGLFSGNGFSALGFFGGLIVAICTALIAYNKKTKTSNSEEL